LFGTEKDDLHIVSKSVEELFITKQLMFLKFCHQIADLLQKITHIQFMTYNLTMMELMSLIISLSNPDHPIQKSHLYPKNCILIKHYTQTKKLQTHTINLSLSTFLFYKRNPVNRLPLATKYFCFFVFFYFFR